MFTGTFNGNMGRDAELKFLNSGAAVLNFSVGVTTGYGERAATVWVKCAMFGKRAETIAPWMLKGKKVLVSGDISEEEWTKQSGEVTKTLKCNVNDINMLSPKNEQQQQQTQQPAQQQTQQPAQQQAMQDEFDADIPF